MSRLFCIILSSVVISAYAGNLDTYFFNNSLRLDFVISGNNDTCSIQAIQWKIEPYWSGNPSSYILHNNAGDYLVMLNDLETGILIYQNGYSDLFAEWQCLKQQDSIFHYKNSLRIPLSKKDSRLRIYRTYNHSKKQLLFEEIIDASCAQKSIEKNQFRIGLHYLGNYKKNLDIVFLAEGYTRDEQKKFKADAQNMIDEMLAWEPYKQYKKSIDFHYVFNPSLESGTSIPQKGIIKNTVLRSSFNILGSERYLLATDSYLIRDAASLVPYDIICVLVNTDEYGGGGIFNHHLAISTKNPQAGFVFCHEMAHLLAFLADEYSDDTKELPAQACFNGEPLQENISNLMDFEKKWAALINGTDKEIGMYEGANYQKKGFYRPYLHCAMREYYHSYCPVCKRVIIEMLEYYTKK